MTQWKHFKDNYLYQTIFMLLMLVASILLLDGRARLFASILYTIVIVLLIVGNYISWKKKFK